MARWTVFCKSRRRQHGRKPITAAGLGSAEPARGRVADFHSPPASGGECTTFGAPLVFTLSAASDPFLRAHDRVQRRSHLYPELVAFHPLQRPLWTAVAPRLLDRGGAAGLWHSA